MIVFTFDDARKDVFENAYPIMKKFGMPGVLYVISKTLTESYVPTAHAFDRSYDGEYVDLEMVNTLIKSGWEIGSHGYTHKPNSTDLIQGYKTLENVLKVKKIGLSLPHSRIDDSSINDFYNENINSLSYIRIGRKNKKNVLNIIKYVLHKIFNNKSTYYLLNKNNINKKEDIDKIYYSIPVLNDDKVDNIINFVKKNNSTNVDVIFMFHSIDNLTDKWSFNIQKFNDLCQKLNEIKQTANIEIGVLNNDKSK